MKENGEALYDGTRRKWKDELHIIAKLKRKATLAQAAREKMEREKEQGPTQMGNDSGHEANLEES